MLGDACAGEQPAQQDFVADHGDGSQIREGGNREFQRGDELDGAEVVPHGVHRDGAGDGGVIAHACKTTESGRARRP